MAVRSSDIIRIRLPDAPVVSFLFLYCVQIGISSDLMRLLIVLSIVSRNLSEVRNCRWTLLSGVFSTPNFSLDLLDATVAPTLRIFVATIAGVVSVIVVAAGLSFQRRRLLL